MRGQVLYTSGMIMIGMEGKVSLLGPLVPWLFVGYMATCMEPWVLQFFKGPENGYCMFISIESRLRRVDVLLNHLTEVVSEKDKIIDRLQSRAAENSLKIEAPFQKYAYSVNLFTIYDFLFSRKFSSFIFHSLSFTQGKPSQQAQHVQSYTFSENIQLVSTYNIVKVQFTPSYNFPGWHKYIIKQHIEWADYLL